MYLDKITVIAKRNHHQKYNRKLYEIINVKQKKTKQKKERNAKFQSFYYYDIRAKRLFPIKILSFLLLKIVKILCNSFKGSNLF